MGCNINSIWTTPEFDAASRDFSYEDYLKIHCLSGCTGTVVLPDTYDLLKAAFNLDMQLSRGV